MSLEVDSSQTRTEKSDSRHVRLGGEEERISIDPDPNNIKVFIASKRECYAAGVDCECDFFNKKDGSNTEDFLMKLVKFKKEDTLV